MIFDLSYKEAAKASIGQAVIAGSHTAVVLGAKGFSRLQNDAPLYKPMLELRPGDVFTPRHRNSILTLIVCKDGVQSGGCVLLQTVEIDGVVVDGPGRVSDALGLKVPKDPGRVEQREDGTLELKMARLGPATVASPPSRKREGNGIGDAVLTKYMKSIADKFMEVKPRPVTFLEYLNALLEGCTDEDAFRKRLKAAQ